MKNRIIYISLFIALLGLCSCSMEEQYAPVGNESTIQLIPRLTSFNGVDVATKADGDAPEFESAIYTAYLLIFDNEGNLVHFTPVEGIDGAWSQRVTMKNLTSAKACFIANVPKDFAEGIDTIDELNSAVLNITYAAYDEAGGYLGVPKLTVNGETKLCIPMFGSVPVANMTHNQTYSIPVKRLFAKVSVELKLDVTFEGDWATAFQTYTNYELNEWKLQNLPNKVRLVEDINSESPWKDGKDNPNIATPSQSPDISAKIYNTESSASGDKSYSFDCYVPEFYMNPIQNPTNDQRYKPKNHPDGTYPIYLELVGQYNAYSITSTDINYKVYLGNDNVSNFSLARNTHYKNFLTIKGTTNNDKSEVEENLDHRVTTITITNPVAKAGKSANCYVINATGEYNFPAYKGAYNDLTDAELCNNQTAKELVILANDNSSNIELTDYTYDPERNLVTFTVTSVANGNVVLGLKNQDGSLEWSWHLWFNQEFNAGALGQWAQINTQTMPDGTTKMIDRNLGASPSTIESLTAGAVVGNYYKYGHRAPYFTDSQNGAAYHGYKESDYSSWNTIDKSHTDPCPPGYRVPASSVWSTTTAGKDGSPISAFLYWNSGTNYIYYPYSGYISSSGQTINAYGEPYTYNGYHADEMQFSLGLGYKIKEIYYKITIDKEAGVLISSDGNAFVYEAMNEGLLPDLQITGGKYCYGYEINLPFVGTIVRWSEWDDIDVNASGVQTLLLQARSELENTETVKNLLKPSMSFGTINNANGYQVRCVNE